ncbi:MAG TPA: OmpA family protein [Aliiroseovarius sp.]|nr:OmpA family protein [Aliiroseovarius sp.]
MLITPKPRLLAALATIAALAACENNPYWGTEAGALLDGGRATGAAALNAGVQTGQISYVVSLQNRFASEVPTTVTFAFNSAVLDENARRILRQQASWIRQFPEVRFKVFGHTDAVGSAAYNKRLGLRRARAVVNYLISQGGISRSRLQAVVSYGETQPVVVTQGREPRNRRTVTEVTGFVQNHPMILNGKYAEVVYREYLVSAVPPSTLGQTLQSGGGDG